MSKFRSQGSMTVLVVVAVVALNVLLLLTHTPGLLRVVVLLLSVGLFGRWAKGFSK